MRGRVRDSGETEAAIAERAIAIGYDSVLGGDRHIALFVCVNPARSKLQKLARLLWDAWSLKVDQMGSV